MNRILAAALVAAAFASPALADGDAAAGKTVFNKCKACHNAAEEKNMVGPHLVGVAGRPMAAVADYAAKYSEGLKTMGAEGKVWDDANLTAYLTKPKEFNPDSKMAFAGLPKPEDIANVIAYLKADPKP
ncbi:MAG: c-type cytochrome [Phyllobacteriaceae bacterium]|nr:c-type cytochrome [Phyllobacteriaceae bacterium]